MTSRNVSAQEPLDENDKKATLVRQFYVPFNTGETCIYQSILAVNWIDNPLNPRQAPERDDFPCGLYSSSFQQ